jgi:hypothetical protein
MNQEFIVNTTQKCSSILENAISEKPQFFKKDEDLLVLLNVNLLKEILKVYKFIAHKYVETDGSVTISLDNIDLIESSVSEDEAKFELAKSIKEYSEEFYVNFEIWGTALNRKEHIAFVLKAILAENIDEIIDEIKII